MTSAHSKPLQPRHTSERRGDQLAISIPSAQNPLFLLLWACLVVLAALTIRWTVQSLERAFADGSLSGWEPWLIPWLVIWLLLGASLAFGLLFYVVRKEEIEVRKEGLRLGSNLRRSRREFAAEEIESLRAELSHPTDTRFDRIRSLGALASDSSLELGNAMEAELRTWHNLAFEYRGATIRFGLQLGKDEAQQILAEIMQSYPQFKTET